MMKTRMKMEREMRNKCLRLKWKELGYCKTLDTTSPFSLTITDMKRASYINRTNLVYEKKNSVAKACMTDALGSQVFRNLTNGL